MKTNIEKSKSILAAIMLFVTCFMYAHDVNYNKQILKHWSVIKENKVIDGSFTMFKDGKVFIEDANSTVVSFPLQSFSKEDQDIVLNKYAHIKELNKYLQIEQNNNTNILFDYKFWIVFSIILILGMITFLYSRKRQVKYLTPILTVGILISLYSFTKKSTRALQTSSTSTSFLDSAFTPFKPNVHTYWDATYFYVESKGIPTTHGMMVGIASNGWQRQVPIPQCYIGANAWPIPLNPVIATTPVPVNTINFVRGAIAVAVNGIAIFNPYTNAGVDAYLAGQLDNYGGHCGRADDYHYHIAPLHLYGTTSSTLPIAFGLDGFAVYGSVEPDGTPMTTLDANHGHVGSNGVYHYHGTSSAPYMIANMVGQVTQDATYQIIPQAQAQPIRIPQSPLPGALITACTPNSSNNGYTLKYTLSSQSDSIVYNWTTAGVYTFNFYTPGSFTDTVYNHGFVQCTVPLTSIKNIKATDNSVLIYPNPSAGILNVQLDKTVNENNVLEIVIYNNLGEVVYRTNKYSQNIDVRNLAKGNYMLKVQLPNSQLTKKLLIE